MLELASPEEAAKYAGYMVRSFVEDNGAMCWCTGKVCISGCVLAAGGAAVRGVHGAVVRGGQRGHVLVHREGVY